MMLMAASWPSKREAAVTNRSFWSVILFFFLFEQDSI